MEQEKKPSQPESGRMEREGEQNRKQQEEKFPGQNQPGQRQPGQQEQWKQPGQTGEEKKREDVA